MAKKNRSKSVVKKTKRRFKNSVLNSFKGNNDIVKPIRSKEYSPILNPNRLLSIDDFIFKKNGIYRAISGTVVYEQNHDIKNTTKILFKKCIEESGIQFLNGQVSSQDLDILFSDFKNKLNFRSPTTTDNRLFKNVNDNIYISKLKEVLFTSSKWENKSEIFNEMSLDVVACTVHRGNVIFYIWEVVDDSRSTYVFKFSKDQIFWKNRIAEYFTSNEIHKRLLIRNRLVNNHHIKLIKIKHDNVENWIKNVRAVLCN